MFLYSAKLLIRYEGGIKKCWDIEGLKHLCLMCPFIESFWRFSLHKTKKEINKEKDTEWRKQRIQYRRAKKRGSMKITSFSLESNWSRLEERMEDCGRFWEEQWSIWYVWTFEKKIDSWQTCWIWNKIVIGKWWKW